MLLGKGSRLSRNHAGSGEQAGESAQQAREPDEEPAVGAQLGDAAGECCDFNLSPSVRRRRGRHSAYAFRMQCDLPQFGALCDIMSLSDLASGRLVWCLVCFLFVFSAIVKNDVEKNPLLKLPIFYSAASN